MSDDFTTEEEVEALPVYFSPFWPLLILMVGFTLWLGYQDFELNAQRSALVAEFTEAGPTIESAEKLQARYNSMMKDLIDSSSKDSDIAAIAKVGVQAGIQAGLIHVKKSDTDTNSSSPGSSSDTTPSK